MSASRQDSFSTLLLSDDETPVGIPRKDKNNHPFAGGLGVRSAGLEPATFRFVVRFFERDAVGCGARVRFLEVFGGMRRVAAVSGSRQRPRQRGEAAS